MGEVAFSFFSTNSGVTSGVSSSFVSSSFELLLSLFDSSSAANTIVFGSGTIVSVIFLKPRIPSPTLSENIFSGAYHLRQLTKHCDWDFAIGYEHIGCSGLRYSLLVTADEVSHALPLAGLILKAFGLPIRIVSDFPHLLHAF